MNEDCNSKFSEFFDVAKQLSYFEAQHSVEAEKQGNEWKITFVFPRGEHSLDRKYSLEGSLEVPIESIGDEDGYSSKYRIFQNYFTLYFKNLLDNLKNTERLWR